MTSPDGSGRRAATPTAGSKTTRSLLSSELNLDDAEQRKHTGNSSPLEWCTVMILTALSDGSGDTDEAAPFSIIFPVNSRKELSVVNPPDSAVLARDRTEFSFLRISFMLSPSPASVISRFSERIR